MSKRKRERSLRPKAVVMGLVRASSDDVDGARTQALLLPEEEWQPQLPSCQRCRQGGV